MKKLKERVKERRKEGSNLRKEGRKNLPYKLISYYS